jgi:methionyl-tRNA formyltransferase
VLALNQTAAGHLKPVRQPAEGVTYAHKIEKADGVLCVTQLQRAGGKRLAAADFLRGFALGAGATFDAPPAEA